MERKKDLARLFFLKSERQYTRKKHETKSRGFSREKNNNRGVLSITPRAIASVSHHEVSITPRGVIDSTTRTHGIN